MARCKEGASTELVNPEFYANEVWLHGSFWTDTLYCSPSQ